MSSDDAGGGNLQENRVDLLIAVRLAALPGNIESLRAGPAYHAESQRIYAGSVVIGICRPHAPGSQRHGVRAGDRDADIAVADRDAGGPVGGRAPGTTYGALPTVVARCRHHIFGSGRRRSR